MSKKKVLRLFTSYFPYGKYEVYMENEIIALAEKFDHVYIYPLKYLNELRSLPENCTVITPIKSSFNTTKLTFRYPFLVLKLIFLQFYSTGFLKTIKYRSHLKHYLFTQLNLFHYYKSEFITYKNDIYYSNWFVDWSLSLTLLKKKNIISNFCTRAHRYDLYDNEYPIGFIPFKKFQTKYVDVVASISQDGIEYLKEYNPELRNKLHLFRLGSPDNGINPINSSSTLQIVTCSNLKPVKRIHLLVEALKQVKSTIEWNHFGDGLLSEEIQSQCLSLPSNIKYIFHGRLTSSDLLEFYRKHSVDCLINLSSSEGIPVSMMEAISFGIPIIATNIGGTSEIINSQSGILLDSDFKIEELVSILDNLNDSKLRTEEFRNSTRKFWLNNFNAKNCFSKFADFLYTIR